MCWLLPGSFDCFGCPRASVHSPSIARLAVFLCGPGAFLHALSGPSTICPFPPHGWSAPDGLPPPRGSHRASGRVPAPLPPTEEGAAGGGGKGWGSRGAPCRPCAMSTGPRHASHARGTGGCGTAATAITRGIPGCTINEGDPYVAGSWTCTSNPACGRGWLLCTLPTLPQSQNLYVWALSLLFPVLPFRALVQIGGEPHSFHRRMTLPVAGRP